MEFGHSYDSPVQNLNKYSPLAAPGMNLLDVNIR